MNFSENNFNFDTDINVNVVADIDANASQNLNTNINASLNLDSLPKTGSLLFVDTYSIQRANHYAEAHARNVLVSDSSRSLDLLQAGTHPDFCLVTLEAKSQQIKIDQIRNLLEWANHKPLIASKKVAIITPANTLNIAGANALLKTLEEPFLQTLFLLVTDKPSFIPETIRSRCFWVRLKSDFKEISEKNISLTSILAKIIKDIDDLDKDKIDFISLATQWAKDDPKIICDAFFLWIQKRIKDLMLFQLKGNEGMQCKPWWNLLDSVTKAKVALLGNSQPNPQLLLESLLIEYQGICK